VEATGDAEGCGWALFVKSSADEELERLRTTSDLQDELLEAAAMRDLADPIKCSSSTGSAYWQEADDPRPDALAWTCVDVETPEETAAREEVEAAEVRQLAEDSTRAAEVRQLAEDRRLAAEERRQADQRAAEEKRQAEAKAEREAVARGDLVVCRLAGGSGIVQPPAIAIDLETQYGHRWTCDFGAAGDARRANTLAEMPAAPKGMVNCTSTHRSFK
jgi:hypothetical protein